MEEHNNVFDTICSINVLFEQVFVWCRDRFSSRKKDGETVLLLVTVQCFEQTLYLCLALPLCFGSNSMSDVKSAFVVGYARLLWTRAELVVRVSVG